MAQPVIQTAFHAGEWAPSLAARVDVGKYHQACALALNYYVDYRGGLASRMGTRWLLQAKISSSPVRLIGFQAGSIVGYVLEFGDLYIRFYFNGSPVLETAVALTSATAVSPAVFGLVAHGLQNGDWVFSSLFAGGTWSTLNNRYFIVTNAAANTFQLTDLFGTAISGAGLGVWTAGSFGRVYTLPSPYAAADLALLKYTQNINRMYICHPDYSPQILTLITATNWQITPMTVGSTVSSPTGLALATTLAAGSVNYSYTVTSVDANGQESAAATPVALANRTDLRTVAGTIRASWNAVTGAVRYNVYKAEVSYSGSVVSGAAHGFIGDTTGTQFDDSNIASDFIEQPPIPQNPFVGASVDSVTVTNRGTYTTVPSVTIAAPPAGQTATAVADIQMTIVAINNNGIGYTAGDILSVPGTDGGSIRVDTVDGSGNILTVSISNPGARQVSSPANPVSITGGTGAFATFDLTWGIGRITIINQGTGYLTAPAVTFSAGAATATAVLGAASSGNPSVPQFADQRLYLMGPEGSPHQFNASRPGIFNNFDISNPAQPDDAISGILVSGVLNEIKAAIDMPSGLIIFADKAAWLLYGESPGQAATAVNVTAKPQAYVGSSDVQPIVANDNILYVQANGASVRNLNYNFYTNVYTGTDISILSSHLFYMKEITEWCWAEEPFKLLWAIRDDGVMLSLTFVKEQELIGWTHSDTLGLWKSCAAVVEQIATMRVNAVYFVAERVINGQTLKYIERMEDRVFTNYQNCWCVDSGLQYSGAPATIMSGLQHLTGASVVGLADGIPFTAIVSATGSITLATAASLVTVGLAFVPDFQSLAIDTGNPTIQGKMKKLTGPTLRVKDTLGLQVGQSFSTVIDIDDLIIGKVGTMTNEPVTGLVTGDVRQNLDPDWTEQGQFCVRQPLPYPSMILGIVPELTVGDTEK